MAVVRDIYESIDKIAPFDTQEGFDNAGFLVGHGDREVRRLLVALDITPEVAAEAVGRGAELIVSHHPVIFRPVKSVTDATVTGRVLMALLEGGVAAICAHTNLDAATEGSTAVWPRPWSCPTPASCARQGRTLWAGPTASGGWGRSTGRGCPPGSTPPM